MRTWTTSVFVVLTLGCAATAGLAQNDSMHANLLPPCTADNGNRAQMLADLKILAPGTDPQSIADRAQLGIPNVPASQVTIVTTNATCTSAGQAVSRELGVPHPANGRSVSVIKVGNAYVVRDPAVTAGHHDINFVFNSNFQVLRSKYGA